jgi:hypothetical protein
MRRTTTPANATSNATSSRSDKPPVSANAAPASNPRTSTASTTKQPSPLAPNTSPPVPSQLLRVSERTKSAQIRTQQRKTRYDRKKLMAYRKGMLR